MKAYFLKAEDQLWEKVIAAATGPHAHMELQFSDGLFFSSTNELGPRFCGREDLFDQSAAAWDVIDIPMTPQDEATVRALANMVTVGISGEKPAYGMNHIVLDFLPVPLSFSAPDKWICSESCVYALQSVGLYMGWIPQQISPHEAYEILQKELPIWGPLRFKVTA